MSKFSTNPHYCKVGNRNKHKKRRVPSSQRTAGRRNRATNREIARLANANAAQTIGRLVEVFVKGKSGQTRTMVERNSFGILSITRYDAAGRSYEVVKDSPMWQKCEVELDKLIAVK